MDSIPAEDKFKGRALSSSTVWFSSTLNVSARLLFITKGFFCLFLVYPQGIAARPPTDYTQATQVFSNIKSRKRSLGVLLGCFFFLNLKILLFYNINNNLIQQNTPRIQDSSCTSEVVHKLKGCLKA